MGEDTKVEKAKPMQTVEKIRPKKGDKAWKDKIVPWIEKNRDKMSLDQVISTLQRGYFISASLKKHIEDDYREDILFQHHLKNILKMSTILNKLKDNNEYYHGVGKQYLSNSDIGALLNNPKMFGVSREDDINLAKGRLFHELLLEPDKAIDFPVIDVSSRNTKKSDQRC
jgi:hypothetical protein